jgi:hypothetical protein
MDNPQPNAFATGRNPEHAAVAVTTGLLQMLSREEVAGVIAHELAHIRNRDTLTMTITATIAGAISMLAQFGFFFGGHRDSNNGPGVIGTLAMVIVAPIAAMLVQNQPHAGIRRRRTRRPHQRAGGRSRLRAGEDFRHCGGRCKPHRRARAGNGAPFHRQSADRPRDGQPVLHPSIDRESHRRAATIGGGNRCRRQGAPDCARLSQTLGKPMGQCGQPRRKSRPLGLMPSALAASGRFVPNDGHGPS